MTDSTLLNFLQQFVSLANAMLLLWLGPTIALSAERQRWLIWSAGAAVTAAGLFFMLHSVIVASNIGAVIANVRLWWLVGWLPVIFLPAAWYGMTQWYVGDLSRPVTSSVWTRLALFGVIVLTLLIAAIFLISNPLPPSAAQLPVLQLLPNVAFAVLYPIDIIVCIVLSLYTLGRPTPNGPGLSGMDGDEARARARPWLMATAAALLIVTLLVSWGVWWLLQYGRTFNLMDLYLQKTYQIVWLDVIVAIVIGVAILTLGQGIVAYEVFTGKRFPRNDLRRQWRNAIILSLGFSAALALQLRGIYIAVLAVMVIAIFYALLNWRNAHARERYIEQLRPFVGSQQIYDTLTLIESRDAAAQQLQALCQNILHTELAYLVPLGRFVTLIQRPLSYPDDAPPLGEIPQLDEAARQPRTMCVPITPPITQAHSAGLRYAVPLWGQQGWIGLLLLGQKRGKALYTQEEIEIARANGERLLDAQATAELAQRLMQAQRQRIAESQIADRRTRRVLHDDVLPRLHAAMLTTHDEDAIKALSEAHRDLAQLLRELPAVMQLQLNSRGLFGALRDLIEREFAHDFDTVDWDVADEAEAAAKRLPESSVEVLFHAAREAIRNAARYGRGGAIGGTSSGQEHHLLHLQIHGALRDGSLQVSIMDDGVGVGAATAQLGSGNGLALHSAMLAVIGGSLTITSQSTGTHVALACPIDKEAASPKIKPSVI